MRVSTPYSLKTLDPGAFASAVLGCIPADRVLRIVEGTEYAMYRDDPAGFLEQILHAKLYCDLRKICRSVVKNRVTIVRSCNGPGKTFVAARLALWFYKVFRGAQVYTAAAPPESNLKRLLWGEISAAILDHPDIFSGDKLTDMHLTRSPLEFVTGVAIPTTGSDKEREARFSGKHAPGGHMLFVLDEADAIPECVFSGIESCMSAGDNVRLLCLFNPRFKGSVVYRMERDHACKVVCLSAFEHPNVRNATTVIPGAISHRTVVQRINKWCRPAMPDDPPELARFKLPKYLAGASVETEIEGETTPPLQAGEYIVTNPVFSYMVLGRYPTSDTNTLIHEEWVLAARNRWDEHVRKHGQVPPAGVRPFLGLDVADDGKDSNVQTLRYGGWVAPLKRWSGVDPIMSADRAIKDYQDARASVAYVDSVGVGAGCVPHMRRAGCNAHKVKNSFAPTYRTELGEFQNMGDQLAWEVREWLRTSKQAMLPPDERLIEQLQVLTYEVRKGKLAVMDKATVKDIIGHSPDEFDSLAMTFFKPSTLHAPLDVEACLS